MLGSPKTISISHRTIVFIAVFVFGIWFFYQIRDILLMIFISIILMSALNPLVDRLYKAGFPRGISIFIIYLAIWGGLGGVIASIIPSLVDQTAKMIKLLPLSIARVEIINSYQQDIIQQFIVKVGTLPEYVLKFTIGLFSNILNILTTVVIAFYLLLQRQKINDFLASLLKDETHSKAQKTILEIERRLGSWVRGELFLMFVVGLMTYIGLVILGVDIPLPLALLAGFLEIVPNLGPTISAVPAVLIAFTMHPLLGLSTLALYVLIQFVENNFLVPKIMEKATGVNPLVSIVGLMIGFRLAGPVGAILSIPFIITIQTIGIEYFSIKHLESLSS